MTSTRSPRSSTRRWAGALLLAAAAVAAPGAARGEAPAPAPAPTAQALRERARAVLADPRFQQGVPAVVATGPTESPPPGPFGFSLPVSPVVALAGAGVSRLLLFVLLAVALTLLATWVAQEVAGRLRGPAPAVGGAAAATPGAAGPDGAATLGLALRLAREGRHAEALHLLLLAAIRLLAARSPEPPPASSTSRELARTLPLAGEARRAFGELVAAVERSLFGGAPVDAAELERNLARFRTATGAGEAGPP